MNTETLRLIIDDAVPNAGKEESQQIILLWKSLQQHLQGVTFTVEDPARAALDEFRVWVDAEPLIALLETAASHEQGFVEYLQKAIAEDLHIGAELRLQIQASAPLARLTLYHAAHVLLHQLMLAMNIALPGSCQFLETYFEGKEAELFEAPEFDSRMFTNSWLGANDVNWPQLRQLDFPLVWQWLQQQALSEADTALRIVNKVLFGLLDLCQPRSMFAAGDILLVAHMLESLVEANEELSYSGLVRDRIVAILGVPDSRADSFNELYRLKRAMIRGELPVRRPALIYHDADDELLQQLEAHNSPIEQALAVLLAIIQDLVINQARGYKFSETFDRLLS